MRYLILACLFAITILLHPVETYAKGLDLSPAQYELAKKIASGYCEAKNDGLSIESSFNAAIRSSWLEVLALSFSDEQSEELDQQLNSNKEFYDFTIKKIKSNCGLTSKELALNLQN